jgi:hypothetical protein
MRIKLIALLAAWGLGVVACAEGTGEADVANLSNGGSGVDAGGTGGQSSNATSSDPSSGATESDPPPPPMSSEVSGSYSLDVSCADIPVIDLCILSAQADKDVTFTLPPGTQRSSIVYTVDPQGPSAGGTVAFAGDNPLDGTVHMHGFADALSSVHIAVTGVMVVPE